MFHSPDQAKPKNMLEEADFWLPRNLFKSNLDNFPEKYNFGQSKILSMKVL